MTRLIVNADDFGLTQGVNQAVMHAHKDGILTSATLMPGGLAWREAVELSRATPTLGVGIHLTLTSLFPVLPPGQLPSLVDGDGRFRRQLGRAPLWKRDEVEREWRAQIERLLREGLKPTHLDSHHHVHHWPPLMDVACGLAEDYSIPAVRAISPASFHLMKIPIWQRSLAAWAWRRAEGHPLGKTKTVVALESVAASRDSLAAYVQRLGPGIHELYCHPGSPADPGLLSLSSLTERRSGETELLCSDWVKAILGQAGIRLVSYTIFS